MGIMDQMMIIMDNLMTSTVKLMNSMGNNNLAMVMEQDNKIKKFNQIIKQQIKILINQKNKKRNMKQKKLLLYQLLKNSRIFLVMHKSKTQLLLMNVISIKL